MSDPPGIPPSSDPLGLRHLASISDAAASVYNNIINRVAGAIGTSYDDLTMVVRARRQAAARGLLAAQEADSEAYRRVLIARTDAEITAPSVQYGQLEARARQRLIATAVRHQENLEEITVAAIRHIVKEVEDGKEIIQPAARVADDWMVEFIDMCKNATHTRMRELWGRVLAGEVQSPGSFSIRSLLTLKTILPIEAEQFGRIANLVFQGVIKSSWIFTNDINRVIEEGGIDLDVYLTLSSAGLLAPSQGLGWETGEPGKAVVLIYHPYLITFEYRGAGFSKFEVPVWSLTAVGQELLQLITREHDWDYVRSLVKFQESNEWYLRVVLTPEGYPTPPPDIPTQKG
jgi:hypothetical protein